MLKKMRWRFIGAAMAAITAVVLLLLCCINIWNYHNITERMDGTLHVLAGAGGRTSAEGAQPGRLPGERTLPFPGELPYMIRFFAVHYDADGAVEHIDQDYIASLSGEEAAQLAARILERGRSQGFEGGYRYLVYGNGAGETVLCLHAGRELQAIRELLLTTVLIAAACLAVVFLLVLLFAGRAVAPYLRNLEMQKQFITNAGHELKTPLTAISTSADVLAMEYEDDEWVRNIQRQSGRLARLIGDLVTLSRLDEEQPLPEKTAFSLSDALWETADPFVPLIQARGKTYTQDIEDGLTVTGDRAAVQQMAGILLDNAVKYSPAGGAIRLRAWHSGRKTVIEVSNTCETLEKQALEHLFDRFYRADTSHSAAVSGSGLGLSIAKATAKAHGGKIRVEQADGEIRFRVVL